MMLQSSACKMLFDFTRASAHIGSVYTINKEIRFRTMGCLHEYLVTALSRWLIGTFSFSSFTCVFIQFLFLKRYLQLCLSSAEFRSYTEGKSILSRHIVLIHVLLMAEDWMILIEFLLPIAFSANCPVCYNSQYTEVLKVDLTRTAYYSNHHV